ncbi:MAG: hypothetical protein J0I12_14740 [Candidatus Eremiobacteraeota bacterium]|nr:hypothetical protein [Candidatus Eremiobacteraeota bacterium]
MSGQLAGNSPLNPNASFEAKQDRGRLVLPDCPGCDAALHLESLSLNEQTRCPHCNSLLLLVKIDGVVMFLREGWT